MTPEFYVDVVNPLARNFKKLYGVDILERCGKIELRYQIFWPEDSLKKVKAQVLTWAEKQNLTILKVEEICLIRDLKAPSK